MYFSGEDSNNITYDDPANKCIRINPSLYARVQDDNEQNIRVFLDTHLLKIRNISHNQKLPTLEHIISKHNASVSTGSTTVMSASNYVTKAMMTAEFREISSDEFKITYLAPLDKVIKKTNFGRRIIAEDYGYPLGDARHVEDDIQIYFDEEIASSIKRFYRDILDEYHHFGHASIIPPLSTNPNFKPDIVHVSWDETLARQNPDICFAIGDYKTENYFLTKGLQELKLAITGFVEKRLGLKQLRSHENQHLFEDREWSPRVLCALVLRKYLYQAFLCGTDRVFISDHQSFSGFFKYEIMDDGQMIIDYYVINNPETVEHGITLRSAIAGFFYKDNTEALSTKEKLAGLIEISQKTKGPDPLANVLPRLVEEPTPSCKRKRSKISGSQLRERLITIEESYEVDFDAIRGNTFCRIIYNSAASFPNLGLLLPSTVFVKWYNYPEQAQENFPDKDSYYDMYVNELEINEILANSSFAANFAKLIISGYWNGIPSQPMHIFENLGEEIPSTEWDKFRVHKVVKERLAEIHSLGISHNDIRLDNMHVSISGKVTLIDFGLSSYPSSEEQKKRDFEALDELVPIIGYGISGEDKIRDVVLAKNENNESGWNDHANSSDEIVFDESVLESDDTPGSTKVDFNSKYDET
ncbi:DEHA2F27368p [Debaryomyces hansenii CBS767]|uniref:DEHA2F27368p n=1 Tax=Debaryomyces hansenii (strain ATCC 36239 / CBS 767 / BCRC 21394 / JCM 1990 / NBRC 0083 / IGC 2968) TaxID=284592 RepID=Q6BJU3_DEBHA|nr:DEHA2F27368p [Debaryomyces hansenii CBS767]CAG89961.2 DEHA2F27368p [Debaryomyces hansenii CBS767]|eukprot:XP_461528.2 DEHA2F27368p [Debaryomyces hansenii CBS767]